MDTQICMNFENMGIRGKKYVVTQILLENTYHSKLVSDIATVDHLVNYNDRTSLQPVKGIQIFVDDLYVFGNQYENDCAFIVQHCPMFIMR